MNVYHHSHQWVGTKLGRRVLAVLAVALIGLAPVAQAEIVNMVAVVNGAQVEVPVASTTLGVGKFIVDTDANTMTYEITHSGLTSGETAAHIHGFADAGVSTGVKHPLRGGLFKTGGWNYPDGDEADILAGRTYVNIHSGDHGGGEIRGQIVDMVAMIDSAQEGDVSNTSAAVGTGLFLIDTVANTLNYHIIFSGLEGAESAAHIHGFAIHGTPAGVQHPLPAGSSKIRVWNYPEVDEAAILAGQTYVNVHSGPHPGGEIRGQITDCTVPVDSGQAVSLTSNGFGAAAFSRDTSAQELGYYVTYDGLASSELFAHIHGYAPAGTNVGVLHPLPASNPKVGAWDYGAQGGAPGILSETYVNIHTANNGGGAIRGQIWCPIDLTVPTELSAFVVD